MFGVFLILPALVALFWALMLFFKKDRQGAHKCMAVGLLIFMVAYILFCLLFAPWAGMPLCVAYMAVALFVPFCHFCFFKKAVVIRKSSLNGSIYLIVLMLLILTMVMLVWLSGPELSDAFYNKVVMGEDVEVIPAYSGLPIWRVMEFICFKLFVGILLAVGTAVPVWSFFMILRYDRFVGEYLAGRASKQKKNYLSVLFSMFLAVIPLVWILSGPFYVLRDSPVKLVVCISFTALAAFFIGFYTYRIDFTAEQLRFMIDEDCEIRKLAGIGHDASGGRND